jgi:hypothetical protein
MMNFSLLFVDSPGTGPPSALAGIAQPRRLPEKKDNSSGDLDAELPPLVFPKDSDGDKPNRQGEELPPLVFPKVFVQKSHSEHDAIQLSDKVAISNKGKIIVSNTKQSPSKKVASEVPDLLSDDAYNRTVYEDGIEGPVQSDTVVVTGPNVIHNNKTHEEDVTSSSIEKKENSIKTDSVTSAPPTADASEATPDYRNVSPVHDTHSVSTVSEGNEKGIENFTHAPEEASKGGENSTNPGDAVEASTNNPTADTNITVKDGKKNYVISGKKKEKKFRPVFVNKTVKDATVTKTESTISVQAETTIKPESSTEIKDAATAKLESSTEIKDATTAKLESSTEIKAATTAKLELSTAFKDETTAKSESSAAFKDATTAKTESNTTVSDERIAKSESNTKADEAAAKSESNATIKDETAPQTKSSPSINAEVSSVEPTFTPPAQQSTTTASKPTLEAAPTTPLNIAENVIDHKAEGDIPVAMAASQQHADHSHASSGKSSAFLQPTESAAIFAGVFVGIALIGYIGLLVWRRVLE